MPWGRATPAEPVDQLPIASLILDVFVQQKVLTSSPDSRVEIASNCEDPIGASRHFRRT